MLRSHGNCRADCESVWRTECLVDGYTYRRRLINQNATPATILSRAAAVFTPVRCVVRSGAAGISITPLG